jgi:hypothetical protein
MRFGGVTDDVLSELATHFANGAAEIQHLIETGETIHSLDRKKEDLMQEIERLESERARIQQSSVESIKQRIAQNSPLHQEIVRHVRETFGDILPDSFDFEALTSYVADNSDLTRTQEIGYRGEAAVFRDLRDSGRFQSVKWMRISNRPTDQRIVSGGEEFYIGKWAVPYDIELLTSSDAQLYVEVKSTCFSKGDRRVSHHFVEQQLGLFATPTPQSVLALVFEALSESPEILYFSIGPFTEE